MPSLTEQQLLVALLALAVILLLGRGAGEGARRVGLPEVLGEFFAGFVLGPSVLGAVLPGFSDWLFQSPSSGFVLSALSWLGAILLLLVAGLEVDLAILRAEARPGALAAAAAIIPSIAAGTFFSLILLGRPLASSFFLGMVLSVTAVGVMAKLLIERQELRRRYAQVLLAAGITSEVLVWLMVAVVSAAQQHSPAVAIRSAVFAVGFFVVMLTLGRRFVFWAMRRVADGTRIARAPLTLVLVLMLLAAVLTQAMGLHPLLGAFVVGVLLAQAPRTNRSLLDNLQTLTTGFFAPVFFVLAGMRVNLWRLGGLSAVGLIALLFVVAAGVKVVCGFAGARLGRFGGWESALVAVGLSVRGGTDVIVAIVGVELGLLSARTYTMYAVVAILTVFVTPPLMSWLGTHAPPSAEERARLEGEELERRAYVPGVERVLVPLVPSLLPSLASPLVQRIAVAKHARHQIFDITAFGAEEPARALARSEMRAMAEAERAIAPAGALETVEVARHASDLRHTLRELMAAADQHDLVAFGAHPTAHQTTIAFGRMQDALIQRADADLLVMCAPGERFDAAAVRRVLVPVNGLRYALAAGDLAASLLAANLAEAGESPGTPGAEREERDRACLMLLHVIGLEADTLFWRGQDVRQLRRMGQAVIGELGERVRQLGVPVDAQLRVSGSVAEAVLRELGRARYDLVLLGAYSRGSSGRPYLGAIIPRLLRQSPVPVALLITRGGGSDG